MSDRVVSTTLALVAAFLLLALWFMWQELCQRRWDLQKALRGLDAWRRKARALERARTTQGDSE